MQAQSFRNYISRKYPGTSCHVYFNSASKFILSDPLSEQDAPRFKQEHIPGIGYVVDIENVPIIHLTSEERITKGLPFKMPISEKAVIERLNKHGIIYNDALIHGKLSDLALSLRTQSNMPRAYQQANYSDDSGIRITGRQAAALIPSIVTRITNGEDEAFVRGQLGVKIPGLSLIALEGNQGRPHLDISKAKELNRKVNWDIVGHWRMIAINLGRWEASMLGKTADLSKIPWIKTDQELLLFAMINTGSYNRWAFKASNRVSEQHRNDVTWAQQYICAVANAVALTFYGFTAPITELNVAQVCALAGSNVCLPVSVKRYRDEYEKSTQKAVTEDAAIVTLFNNTMKYAVELLCAHVRIVLPCKQGMFKGMFEGMFQGASSRVLLSFFEIACCMGQRMIELTLPYAELTASDDPASSCTIIHNNNLLRYIAGDDIPLCCFSTSVNKGQYKVDGLKLPALKDDIRPMWEQLLINAYTYGGVSCREFKGEELTDDKLITVYLGRGNYESFFDDRTQATTMFVRERYSDYGIDASSDASSDTFPHTAPFTMDDLDEGSEDDSDANSTAPLPGYDPNDPWHYNNPEPQPF